MGRKGTLMLAGTLGLLLLLGVGCGSSSSGSGEEATTVSLTTIDQLPRATNPVESATSASIVSKALAEVGLPLGSTDAESFDSSSSLAACEMFNMTKQAINSAAEADTILCYIQETFAAAVAAGITDAAGEAIDIYDGSYHVFDLDFSGEPSGSAEEGGPDKVRFRIVKSGDVIREFEMFACVSDSQQEYVKQTIDGNSFSMTSTHSMSGSGGASYAGESSVSGTLNANGNFSNSKSIAMNMSNSDPNFDFWGVLDYAQYPTQGTMTGYLQGSNTYGGQSYTFIDRVAGSVQLIDANTDLDNYDIGLLAMGNGAVRGCVQGGGDDFVDDPDCTEDIESSVNTWRDSFIEAWEGDTALVPPLADPTVSEYYSDVADAVLPTESQPSIGFEGDEAWDCSDAAEAAIAFVEIGADISSCPGLSHNHIDCWHIAGGGGIE